MILQYFSRFQQRIALSFFCLLYVEMGLPVIAHAHEISSAYIPGNHYALPTYNSIGKARNLGFVPGTLGFSSFKEAAVRQPSVWQIAEKLNIKKTAFSSGPTQPEMQSFQSVNANNMVDLFTGDFSYNIPLLDVGGYPVNIHYTSGISMDQEASWVGLGWNINPGTISRNMRGLPDDFNGTDQVEKTLSLKKNRTIGVTGSVNTELFGGSLSLGASIGVFHNNYKGYGTENGINAAINAGSAASGTMTAGLGVTNNSQNGLDVSPSISYKLGSEENKSRGSVSIGTNYNSRMGINSLQMTGQIGLQDVERHKNAKGEESWRSSFGGAFGMNSAINFSTPSFTPSVTIPFTSAQYAFEIKGGGTLFGLFLNGSVRGYGSVQKIADGDKIRNIPAYGYLYYQNAKNNPDVLLDFNREKEMSYRENEPHIAVPMYTYDSYSISGEGIGGMFRPYRSDVGFVFDHAMTTKSSSNSLSLDLGFGDLFHGGLDYDGIFSNSKSNPWSGDNVFKDLIPFKQSDSTFESVYFKNPGEKTEVDQNYYNSIGDTKLMRVDLSPLTAQNVSVVTASNRLSLFQNAASTGKMVFGNNVYRKQRDKRTQVISYLTAIEASNFALDKVIKSYNINSFPTSNCNYNYTPVRRVDTTGPNTQMRKEHHISEISVLNNDGRKYVYGIPVYNYVQKDVSFSVGKTLANAPTYNSLTGQVAYDTSIDNSTNNNKGLDNYFNKEKMPAYAHNFLLSGILSPDYADITGDGITEDDPGDAIKFNYSRIYDNNNPYKWRAPYDSAAYNEGLKTDSRDEKGSYSYGEKEIWYLNSIESKTMMATFVLELDSTRLDSYGVNTENGHINTAQKLYRLKQIDLYSKADYIKNGINNAKPIKTVHFGYSYDLCKGNPSSVAGNGKLTLTKIWFTYNNNNKGILNPYVFTYNSTNPNYLKGATDRWGNFKDSRNNPGQLSNADYPYTLQSGQSNNWDSTQAASNAAAWTLSKIKLPSGGELRVTYESDDYGYVQNKRAMQMFSMAGFGSSPSASPSSALYPANTKGADYQYAFINVTNPVYSRDDISRNYLDGVTKLYFKLFVKMPEDVWGKGSEFVPFYADIDGNNYGVVPGSGNKMIWVKLVTLNEGAPPAVAALQYLRLNLTSKAYPLSEPGDNVDPSDFIKMLLSSSMNITDALGGYGNRARADSLANSITLANSFVRMDNPDMKKLGGGLRVKRIVVYDNFHAMSKSQQQDATYGQEYDYSTIQMINNVPTRISSGVAAYEPAIGGEENPFHQPIEYAEHVSPLAPTNYKYTEEPLGETYFPGPMVGYSKVSVQTINKDKKSATGVEQTEFYTTKDFPTIWEFTPLDNESKKTFNPALQNFFKFYAQHNVTLSQGFRVELNDMNGKLKSQSSFALTDPINPISYTYNFYNVNTDKSLKKQLSSNVTTIDSANGTINTNGQLGKEVEIMVDLREQTSQTISGSLEGNLDIIMLVLVPAYTASIFPMPSSEVNRYRSVAVLKVVNRYAILDSVIHMEKGSKVTTKNMIYDGETGEVVLSRTNNEFDDPIYNFVYPAHWGYTGMGPAYKNIGASWKGVSFKQGKLFIPGISDTSVFKMFESGDELMVNSLDTRAGMSADTCDPNFYIYTGANPTSKKIWAINASKGSEGNKGIYFIDKTGMPFSANGTVANPVTIKVLRSGKRNMSSTPIGAITSMVNPVRTVGGVSKIVFDTSSQVITASAAQFKDFWRVDSSTYRKDTTMVLQRLADSVSINGWSASDVYTYLDIHTPPSFFHHSSDSYLADNNGYFKTYSEDGGSNSTSSYAKSWMLFDLTTNPINSSRKNIPKNALITKATLYLPNDSTIFFTMPYHENLRGTNSSNKSYLMETRGGWIRDFITQNITIGKGFDKVGLFNESKYIVSNPATQVIISATKQGLEHRNDAVNVIPIVQSMVDDYYSTGSNNSPVNGLVMGLVNNGGLNNGTTNQLIYKDRDIGTYKNSSYISIDVNYCLPCALGNKAYYSNTPRPGYYCNDLPKDTFICKPNIVDSAVNPYRWGILGNWRMSRAYTYFDKRKQSDPNAETNIRKDGEIYAFNPYWSFGTGTNQLTASTDTSRWVWNSEMNLFNRKGYEVENKDPLNRYNAGQYGYNKHMPVAVGQNTHNREMMFDGFEDYGYKTDTCISCGTPRFIDLASGGGTLVDTVSHTGKYSLRLAGGQSGSSVIKIASNAQDSLLPSLSVKIDTFLRIKTTVAGKGNGITGKFYNVLGSLCATLKDSINYNWGTVSPAGCPVDNFNGVFTGMIQPRYTDTYVFYSTHDDGITVRIQDTLVLSNPSAVSTDDVTTGSTSDPYNTKVARPVRLIAGKVYKIVVNYWELGGLANVNLSWSSLSGLQAKEIIPKSQLYDDTVTNAGVANTIRYDTSYCVYARSPKAKSIVLNRFSPLQNRQMLFSAWVKEEQACVSGSYSNDQVVLTFDAGSPLSVTLKPTGKIIEGWQRIEQVVTIPSTATTMTISMQALSGSIPVYFDDIRMHPFNSNIKSFVYSPVNLRLMAELDENNYATFYEYDDDGTLIRLKKETERGIKTIKETRSALQKNQ
jgi:hypothetical protein